MSSFWQLRDSNQKPVMQQNNINKVLILDNQNKQKSNGQFEYIQPQQQNFKLNQYQSVETNQYQNLPVLNGYLSQDSTDVSSCSQNMNSANSQQSGFSSCDWIESAISPKKVEVSEIKPLQKTQTNEETYFPRVFSQNMMDIQGPTDFLQRHQITPSMRAKMIDWMIEVLKAYNFSESTFSLSVSIMDKYFAKVERTLKVEELHSIGVVSMFIASKYEEIVPFSLQKIYEKIAHEKISIQQLKQTEADILNTLNFNISFPTLDILSNLMIKYLDSQDFFKQYSRYSKDFIKTINAYMFKLASLDYELLKTYDYKILAVSSVFVSIQVMQQFFPNVNQFQFVVPLLELIGLNYDQIIQPSTRLLTMAKSYDKCLSNLKNLKKYHLDEINKKTSLYFSNRNNRMDQDSD
ncbi:hypothetical protein ABPG74_004494 [Tetrahymena malaccensis]